MCTPELVVKDLFLPYIILTSWEMPFPQLWNNSQCEEESLGENDPSIQLPRSHWRILKLIFLLWFFFSVPSKESIIATQQRFTLLKLSMTWKNFFFKGQRQWERFKILFQLINSLKPFGDLSYRGSPLPGIVQPTEHRLPITVFFSFNSFLFTYKAARLGSTSCCSML